MLILFFFNCLGYPTPDPGTGTRPTAPPPRISIAISEPTIQIVQAGSIVRFKCTGRSLDLGVSLCFAINVQRNFFRTKFMRQIEFSSVAFVVQIIISGANHLWIFYNYIICLGGLELTDYNYHTILFYSAT